VGETRKWFRSARTFDLGVDRHVISSCQPIHGGRAARGAGGTGGCRDGRTISGGRGLGSAARRGCRRQAAQPTDSEEGRSLSRKIWSSRYLRSHSAPKLELSAGRRSTARNGGVGGLTGGQHVCPCGTENRGDRGAAGRRSRGQGASGTPDRNEGGRPRGENRARS
jgi:hypothetical protein